MCERLRDEMRREEVRSHNRKLSLCKAGLLILAQEGCALQSSLLTLEREYGGVKVWDAKRDRTGERF